MELPLYVKNILDTLSKGGYEAYAVGGCVRDSLLGIVPGDYDICTSALPEEVIELFREFTVVPTGIKHGTVTVVSDAPVEITSFRSEGKYSDNRHPDSVIFVKSVEEDLSRRDFTVNAMAYSQQRGIVDPFGGICDLEKKIIRCVGVPETRFDEDGLRIMRALRFASVYGFEIEKDTESALRKKRALLLGISEERLFAEMSKLLMGQSAHIIIDKYPEVIGTFIPEILPMIGFRQHTPHHHLDVWKHTMKVLENSWGDDLSMRWSALLHDCKKPDCFVLDKNGRGHFTSHQELGAKNAFNILTRLKCDNKTKNEVVSLIENHDLYFRGDIPDMQRLINRLGKELPKRIFRFRVYDSMAQNPNTVPEKLLECQRAMKIYNEVVENKLCCFVSDLEIDGFDLIKLGVKPGKQIGETLTKLLFAVIDKKCENNRDKLAAYVADYILKAGNL